MRYTFISCFCLFLSPFLWAQDPLYILNGTVKDAGTGEALAFASIEACFYVGQTDLNGIFTAEVEEEVCQLTVRYIGYDVYTEKVQLPLEDGKEFIIFLTPSLNLLNQAVITANKFQQKQSESTVSLEIVKPKLVSESNSISADDVLDLVPGVEVIDGQANIRGGTGFSYGAGSRVLLVIDDMPALQYDGGISQWNDIPLENIQQVEVLKGASSVLYGSSALNGVIHFTTANPGLIPKTKVGISYRHFMSPEDEKRKWWDNAPYEATTYVVHARKFKKLDFTTGVFYNNLSSYNQSFSENRGRAYVKTKYALKNNSSFALNADINVGDNSSFFYWGNALRKSFQPADNTVSETQLVRFKIDPVYTFYDKNKDRHVLKGRYYSANNKNSNNQSVRSDFQFASYNYRKSLDKYHAKLILGIEAVASQTNAELYSNSRYTNYNAATFVQWNQKLFDKLNYVIGGRYEYNALNNPDFRYVVGTDTLSVTKKSAQEAKPVFRFGLNYEPVRGTYLRASLGQGYRYPTIAEKFTSTNAGGFTIIPNPDLESETGWSAELAVRQELKFDFLAMYIDIAAFYSRYSNMMEFGLSDMFLGGFQARNIGNTIISGLDNSVGMQWDIGKLKIGALVGYTYIDPRYVNFTPEIAATATVDENILKYRSRHSFKSNLAIDLYDFSFWINQRYNSHMISIDENFELFISGVADFRNNFNQGYNIIDFQLSYRYKFVRVGVNLANATNVLYTERPGLLEAPRNVSIRCEFDISGRTN